MKKFIIFFLVFLTCFSAKAEFQSEYFREINFFDFNIINYVDIIDEEINIYDSGQIDLYLEEYPDKIVGIFLYEPPNHVAFGLWDIVYKRLQIRFWLEDLRDFDNLTHMALVIVTKK